MKTSELEGADLDRAVGKAMGFAFLYDHKFKPSLYWSQGGLIIEREEIGVQCVYSNGKLDGWMADSKKLNDDDNMEQYGPTPLIAAMRCYVASKLGDEVDVPKDFP
jgi:hypothetical protein